MPIESTTPSIAAHTPVINALNRLGARPMLATTATLTPPIRSTYSKAAVPVVFRRKPRALHFIQFFNYLFLFHCSINRVMAKGIENGRFRFQKGGKSRVDLPLIPIRISEESRATALPRQDKHFWGRYSKKGSLH